MSVIISRALPDVRDGLKPSQRRILVAMNDLNLGPNTGRIKCAKICGDTSGNYHPHGEASVYPTLVRMAQEWNLRHVLIDKQGNFGSIAGLPPAAMRYTEARLSAGRGRDADGPEPRNRGHDPQLRRPAPGAGRPAEPVSQSARQRLRRHRRRHGHRHSAAQPARSLRRGHSADRQPASQHARTDGSAAGAGLPDRRHHLRPAGHPRRLHHRPRQDHPPRRAEINEEGRALADHHQGSPLPADAHPPGRGHGRTGQGRTHQGRLTTSRTRAASAPASRCASWST